MVQGLLHAGSGNVHVAQTFRGSTGVIKIHNLQLALRDNEAPIPQTPNP